MAISDHDDGPAWKAYVVQDDLRPWSEQIGNAVHDRPPLVFQIHKELGAASYKLLYET